MKKNVRDKKIFEPEYLYDKNGKKVGVKLDRRSYNYLMDLVNDYHDYKIILKYNRSKKMP